MENWDRLVQMMGWAPQKQVTPDAKDGLRGLTGDTGFRMAQQPMPAQTPDLLNGLMGLLPRDPAPTPTPRGVNPVIGIRG